MESFVEVNKPVGPLGIGVYRTNDHHKINRKMFRDRQRDSSLNNYNILRFNYEKMYNNEGN